MATNKMYFYKMLAPPYSDPLISSLNVLGAYYRGKYKLAPHLKRELWGVVQCEIGNSLYKRFFVRKSLVELIKFPLSMLYGLVRKLAKDMGNRLLEPK